MENDSTKERFSRRGFLGVGSAALAAAAGSLAAGSVMAQENQPRTGPKATDPSPANSALDAQNPESAWPPATDSKSLVQTFEYPFSFANKRTYKGGWSREVTVHQRHVGIPLSSAESRGQGDDGQDPV
jgi:oxalate decarboxylase